VGGLAEEWSSLGSLRDKPLRIFNPAELLSAPVSATLSAWAASPRMEDGSGGLFDIADRNLRNRLRNVREHALKLNAHLLPYDAGASLSFPKYFPSVA